MIIKHLEESLDDGNPRPVSRALVEAHKALRVITIARYGEPENKNGNGH
jgi:hypothetical protein